MEENIRKVFEENLSSSLTEIIISHSSMKDKIAKIKIRPVKIKERLYFQSALYQGKQIFHSNDTKEELMDKLPSWFDENGNRPVFKQVEIQAVNGRTHILISKKGKVTIKTKQDINREAPDLLHNRKKSYIIQEGIQVPFLVDLGILTVDGKVVPSKYDKFKQINRYLEFIEDILPSLAKDREIVIIDFGCGKSYLTFAMYYYLKELKEYDIHVIGVDIKEDVIKKCNELANRYGYDKLDFVTGDIESFEGATSVDMVVTLHACDTATDHGLYKGVKWGAKVILSVPCCQHELNNQLNCGSLDNVLKYGLIKEKTAALLTDAFRANVLELMGYKTQIVEFIDMEHTPKNILIRAIKNKNDVGDLNWKEYEKSIDFFGVNPTLYQLFKNDWK